MEAVGVYGEGNIQEDGSTLTGCETGTELETGTTG